MRTAKVKHKAPYTVECFRQGQWVPVPYHWGSVLQACLFGVREIGPDSWRVCSGGTVLYTAFS